MSNGFTVDTKNKACNECRIPEDKAVHMTESLVDIETNPNILSHLTDAEFDRLLVLGRETEYAPDSFLFHQGERHDGIHFIRSGRIRSLYVSPEGREITLAYWPVGHFVGAPQIFSGGNHMWSSIAVEKSICLWLSGKVLRSLVQEIPNLAVGIIEGLDYKGRLYAALVQIMGTRSIPMRLAHLLLALAETERNSSGQPITLSESFTQEELAAMVGATRQSVSLTLDRFEKDDLITRDTHAIRLVNIPGLEDICF
jgi:CRP/FNR family cyclic AMP-dependent transcriptional regulator